MLIRSRITVFRTSVLLFYTSFFLLASCSRPSHLEQLAKTQIYEITLAIEVYKAHYGYLPVTTNSVKNAGNSCQGVALYTRSEANEATLIDTQLYYYLDVSCYKVKDGEIIDPWGCPYHIMLDTKNLGKIMVGKQYIPGPVVIWSNGHNKRNEYGAGDDVCSWKDID